MHGVVMFRYSLGEEDSRVILQGRSEMVSEMKESEKGCAMGCEAMRGDSMR